MASTVPEIRFERKRDPDASRQPRRLLPVLAIGAVISLVYWALLPYSIPLFDKYTHVPTLWDAGFFQTVAFNYPQLASQYHIFPYTAPVPGYPFTTLEYPFLAGYLFYAIYLVSGGSFATYLIIIQSLDVLAEIGNIGLVYLLVRRFVSSDRRAMIIAMLYAVTPAMLYFTVSRYDAISTFFSLLAVFHFYSKKYKFASVWAIIGALLRYYPAILLVLFLKHGWSNRLGKGYYRDIVAAPLIISFLTLLPLLILNPSAIPREFAFSASFGWNWEAVWGPIDQFVRPVIPALRFFYENQEWMRVPFTILLASTLLLDVKDQAKVLPAYAVGVIFWLNTAWLFSPQYVMWIYPLLMVLSRTNKFLVLTLAVGLAVTLEDPSPFYVFFPMTQFYFILTAAALRTILLWVLCGILLIRIESVRLAPVKARLFARYHAWRTGE